MSNNEGYEESPKQKKEREIESRYGSKPVAKKAFDTALDGMLEKFAMCPKCQGEPEYCPTPQMGYAHCPTRRAAIKHLRQGRGGIRRV